jgi:indolepyruvate ferredoxin oxidoreductase alpha subunit
MKHVGLNVAADPLHSAAYTGVEGGFLIVTADDPWMHSSQNEQDTRWYGLQSYVPVLEPSNPAEACKMAKAAFELSERLKHPVMLRSVTRVSHVRAPVELEPPAPPKWGRFTRDVKRFNLVPANARERKKELVEKWEKMRDVAGEYVSVEGSGDVAVVASGVVYNYVKEALRRLRISATVVKLGMPIPVPRKVAELAKSVIVVEEGDPVVEFQLRAMGVATKGKLDGYFPKYGELDVGKVAAGLAKALDLPYDPPQPPKPPVEPAPRPPALCPGCPHMGTFYILRLATAGLNPLWSGDIGCYSLGINMGQQDLITHMGSSVGLGAGISIAGRHFVVATVGDSTFYHAVLPQLVDVATRQVPILIVVMDNAYTAMTEGQPSPSRAVPVEKITEALGLPTFVIDPVDIKRSVETVKKAVEAVKAGKPAVVVSRRPCTLMAARKARRAGSSGLGTAWIRTGAPVAECATTFSSVAPSPSDLTRRPTWTQRCVSAAACARRCVPSAPSRPGGGGTSGWSYGNKHSNRGSRGPGGFNACEVDRRSRLGRGVRCAHCRDTRDEPAWGIRGGPREVREGGLRPNSRGGRRGLSDRAGGRGGA